MTRGNYLSVNSHSIFHAMKHLQASPFKCGKFERLPLHTRCLHKKWSPREGERKLYTLGVCVGGNYAMIKDDGEISPEIISIVRCRWHRRGKHFSFLPALPRSSSFRRNLALNGVKDELSHSLAREPYQHRLLFFLPRFLVRWKINFISNDIVNCERLRRREGERARRIHISRKHNGDK